MKAARATLRATTALAISRPTIQVGELHFRGLRTSAPVFRNVIQLKPFKDGMQELIDGLSEENVRHGQIPSLRRWRHHAELVGNGEMPEKEQLEHLLEFAKTYREMIGLMGPDSARLFVKKAAQAKPPLPEIPFLAFMDRDTYGLDFDYDTLYRLQKSMLDKLLTADRDVLIEGAKLPGAPVPEVDLLQPKEGARPMIKDEELARAKLVLLDRMSLVSALVPLLRTNSQDITILSMLIAGYLGAFDLTKTGKVPLGLLHKHIRKLIVYMHQSSSQFPVRKELESLSSSRINGLLDNLTQIKAYNIMKKIESSRLTNLYNLVLSYAKPGTLYVEQEEEDDEYDEKEEEEEEEETKEKAAN